MYDADKIEAFIQEMKEYYGDDIQCYLMATLIQSQFGGEIYYNSDHCKVKLGAYYWDKNGSVGASIPKGYLPMSNFGTDILIRLNEAKQKFLSDFEIPTLKGLIKKYEDEVESANKKPMFLEVMHEHLRARHLTMVLKDLKRIRSIG